MATSTFSGPVTSTAGFIGAVTGNITGNITGNVTGNVTGDLTGSVTGNVTGNVTGDLTGNVGATTSAEIAVQCDVSVNTETIAEGGVVSVTKRMTKIVSTGAGAITLAAPAAGSYGAVKVIEMTGGEHDVTLALTNCQGQSSGTTATFSDTNDTLILVAGTNKWNVVGEAGIALS